MKRARCASDAPTCPAPQMTRRGSGSMRSNKMRASGCPCSSPTNSASLKVRASTRESRKVLTDAATASSRKESRRLPLRSPVSSISSFAPTFAGASTSVARAARELRSRTCAIAPVIACDSDCLLRSCIRCEFHRARIFIITGSLCRRFGKPERNAHPMHNPHRASQQVHRIFEERRLIALNQVTDELENPADDEERERPSPVEEEERQAQHNHRNADAVTELVQRMLMLLLVILHERRCRHIHLLSDR